MKALITGASSGIGKCLALSLASKGYDIVLVGRDKEKLEQVSKKIPTNSEVFICEVSKEKDLHNIYDKYKNDNIDILINNAGFGLFGLFTETDLNRELEMIDVNVKAYHILTKLFLNDFVKRNYGYILNVCSSAGFMAGPRLSTYYATKNYVTKLTMAINEELRQMGSKVYVGALCPGPVNTNFTKTANGTFDVKGLSPEYVADYTTKKMFKRKMLIVPGLGVRLGLFALRFAPHRLALSIIYKFQHKKQSN